MVHFLSINIGEMTCSLTSQLDDYRSSVLQREIKLTTLLPELLRKDVLVFCTPGNVLFFLLPSSPSWKSEDLEISGNTTLKTKDLTSSKLLDFNLALILLFI